MKKGKHYHKPSPLNLRAIAAQALADIVVGILLLLIAKAL